MNKWFLKNEWIKPSRKKLVENQTEDKVLIGVTNPLLDFDDLTWSWLKNNVKGFDFFQSTNKKKQHS